VRSLKSRTLFSYLSHEVRGRSYTLEICP
jgi:hypothetical protein